MLPHRSAPDLGTARQHLFKALYLSTPPAEFLLATVANAPSRGEVPSRGLQTNRCRATGRGPAAHARLDFGHKRRKRHEVSIQAHTPHPFDPPLSPSIISTRAKAQIGLDQRCPCPVSNP